MGEEGKKVAALELVGGVGLVGDFSGLESDSSAVMFSPLRADDDGEDPLGRGKDLAEGEGDFDNCEMGERVLPVEKLKLVSQLSENLLDVNNAPLLP